MNLSTQVSLAQLHFKTYGFYPLFDTTKQEDDCYITKVSVSMEKRRQLAQLGLRVYEMTTHCQLKVLPIGSTYDSIYQAQTECFRCEDVVDTVSWIYNEHLTVYELKGFCDECYCSL